MRCEWWFRKGGGCKKNEAGSCPPRSFYTRCLFLNFTLPASLEPPFAAQPPRSRFPITTCESVPLVIGSLVISTCNRR